ncbi:hypothetical protein LTR56_012629 [Elasticomyces elasticus]|nr:hypothetical protein LTR56_012629 [Elasticomyces elasticus]KAK4912573.1 hypothetical protein LTR49_019040 [Elasticomyces elasticus]KAK5751886.1 hypothetical protein LTS12_017992 [Elasticomyces elasticus]
MDASLRDTPALIVRIEKLRDQLVERFQTIVNLSVADRKDRNVTATAQYQIQTETAALIVTAENAQSLIRQLQEMWLFGQLDTLGDSKAQQQNDEHAKSIAGLLRQLADLQKSTMIAGRTESTFEPAMTNGD